MQQNIDLVHSIANWQLMAIHIKARDFIKLIIIRDVIITEVNFELTTLCFDFAAVNCSSSKNLLCLISNLFQPFIIMYLLKNFKDLVLQNCFEVIGLIGKVPNNN